jgi:hypothetical protein
MRAKPTTEPKLPPGLSPQDEALWWEQHRGYWDAVESTDEVIEQPRVRVTKPVNLRLPVDLIDGLRREAELRDLPYQTLIRMWLRERLDSDAR